MKYLKLFYALFRHSLKRYLEDRTGVIGFTFFTTINFFLQIYIVSILFTNTQSLAGWSKEEVFLLVGILRLMTTFFSLFFQRSINHLVGEVKMGNLDIILTKPISSQFYYSFFLMRAFEIVNLSVPLIFIWYALSMLSVSYFWFHLFLMTILIGCGVVIFYSIYISVASLVFRFGRFDSFPSIFNILTIPLIAPTDVYGYSANLVLTFLLPLAFVATIPAKIMVDKSSPLLTLLGIVIAGICLYIASRIWNRSIRHYTSASS